MELETGKAEPSKPVAEASSSNKRKRDEDSDTNAPEDSPFERSLKDLMFAYGDDKKPLQESVDLLRELVREYIRGLIQDAMKIASNNDHAVQFAHIRQVLRKDHPKLYLARTKYNEYKQAQKQRREATRLPSLDF
mmetsp:Transcript_12618/g.25732  ORF Transcript_12618/g.25732 Transcript_12618/m.25732 type:complete len:135 (+) Transcript_12618:1067-1471(+)